MCRGLTCVILSVFNTLIFISGLALLTVGALMKWNMPVLQKVYQLGIEAIQRSLGDRSGQVVSLALGRIQELAGPFGLYFFIGGIIMVVIASIAFIGLCCHVKFFMIVYATIVGALFLAHLMLIIIYFCNRNLILGPLYNGIYNVMINYEAISSETVDSEVAAIIMIAARCCGFNGPEDFYTPNSKFWRNDTIDSTTFTGLMYPVPCCDWKQPLRNEAGFCPRDFSPNNSYFNVPCRWRLNTEFFDKAVLASIVVLAVLAMVFIFSVVNIVLSKKSGAEE